MSKTNYVYDHNNKVISSKKVYVVTVGYEPGNEKPVNVVADEHDAKRIVENYRSRMTEECGENGEITEMHLSANYYALNYENSDLWPEEKIAAHMINARYALTHFGETLTQMMAHIKTAVAR